MTEINQEQESVTIVIPKNRIVGFWDSIALGFKNYFAFDGRSSRGAYWYWTLFSVILGGITGFLDGLFFPELVLSDSGIMPINTVASLAILIPGLALSIRRLHDIGRSGWWILIVITIVGIIPIIYWACQPGLRKPNKFGADVEAGRVESSA